MSSTVGDHRRAQVHRIVWTRPLRWTHFNVEYYILIERCARQPPQPHSKGRRIRLEVLELILRVTRLEAVGRVVPLKERDHRLRIRIEDESRNSFVAVMRVARFAQPLIESH